MNGRLYDPLTAQFLSADKFIQAPYYTQGFNRYVYCYNNPLKYKDPTGWYAINDISLVEVNGNGGGGSSKHDFDLYGKAIYDIGLTSGSSSSSGNYTFSWDDVWYLYYFTPFGGEWSTTSGLRVFKNENQQNRAAEAYNSTWQLDPSIIPQVTSPDASDSRLLAYEGLLPLDYVVDDEVQSGGDYLVYTGDKLNWYNGSGNLVDGYNATSGLPGYQVARYQNVPDAGPIPAGTYSVNLSLSPNRMAAASSSTGEILSGDGIQRIPSSFTTSNGTTYIYPGWGTIRARLNPVSGNMYGRYSFYLHNSHKGFSHGCIEVGGNFFGGLINYGQSHGSIRLIVRYPSMNTSTYGGTYYP